MGANRVQQNGAPLLALFFLDGGGFTIPASPSQVAEAAEASDAVGHNCQFVCNPGGFSYGSAGTSPGRSSC